MGWNDRAFVRKWQLAVLVFCLFLVAGVALAGVIRAFELQHDTQKNRVAAIEDLCGHDNANARSNVQFIRKVSPQLVPLAKRTFHQTKDCHAFALRAVRPKPKDVP
jgi:hypothetical protein